MSYESMMMNTMMRHITIKFLGGTGFTAAFRCAASFSARFCPQSIRMRGTVPIVVGVQGSSVPIGWRLRV
jgi:acetyl-CoA carboxylase carboxyltransferase component